MAEKKVETPEEKAEVQQPESKPEGQPPEPTVEQAVEELRSRLQKQEQDNKSLRGTFESQLREKDSKIKSLEDNQELYKAMLQYASETRGISTEEAEADIKQRQPDLAKALDQKMTELDQKRFNEKYMSYKDRVEEAGLTTKDDAYYEIEALARTGQFDRADKKIEAIKKSRETSKEQTEQKESEEERVERLAKEKTAALMKPEGGAPSAPGAVKLSREEFSKLPISERRELLKKDVTITD